MRQNRAAENKRTFNNSDRDEQSQLPYIQDGNTCTCMLVIEFSELDQNGQIH